MATYKKTSTSESGEKSSYERTSSQSTTKNVLNSALLESILAGLGEQMSGEEIAAYAENLLRPSLDAQIEAAQQKYDTEKLTREQEIENLATQLAGEIEKQKSAYTRSMADVETAALRRGMGRSSYTLETLAAQGDALAKAVRELTQENTRKSEQIQRQITQAAQQREETTGRLNADYQKSLTAKIQELTQAQRKEQSANYLTAVSAAMGKETTGESQTQGESKTSSHSSSVTTSGKKKGGTA